MKRSAGLGLLFLLGCSQAADLQTPPDEQGEAGQTGAEAGDGGTMPSAGRGSAGAMNGAGGGAAGGDTAPKAGSGGSGGRGPVAGNGGSGPPHAGAGGSTSDRGGTWSLGGSPAGGSPEQAGQPAQMLGGAPGAAGSVAMGGSQNVAGSGSAGAPSAACPEASGKLLWTISNAGRTTTNDHHHSFWVWISSGVGDCGSEISIDPGSATTGHFWTPLNSAMMCLDQLQSSSGVKTLPMLTPKYPFPAGAGSWNVTGVCLDVRTNDWSGSGSSETVTVNDVWTVWGSD